MGAPRIYTQILLTIDGILAQEVTTIEVSNENKDQDVETMVRGFAGTTPSPDKTVIKVETFIPAVGFEIDLQGREKGRKVVELACVALGNGTKLTSRGYIRNVAIKSGVGQNTTCSFDFVGEPANFQ